MGLSCQAQGFHSSVAVKCSPTPTRMLMLPGFPLQRFHIGNKWKANVYVARMNDVHIVREMIEIRDGFKECCILSKEDVSDIIENLTVFLTYIIIFLPCAIGSYREIAIAIESKAGDSLT